MSAATGGSIADHLDAEKMLEGIVSRVLRFGVVISLGVSAFGLVVSFLQDSRRLSATGSIRLHYLSYAFRFPHTLHAVYAGVSAFSGIAIVELGLILLLLTPFAWVLISAVVFAYHKDKALSIVAFTVFAILVLSVSLGKSG